MRSEFLTSEDAVEAIDVLCSAFFDYPVFRYVLDDDPDTYADHLRALVGYFCRKRLVRGWPVLGVRLDRRLAAVALVSEPPEDPPPAELEALRAGLAASVGTAALERLGRYETESERDAPRAPCHFLGMIGVLPEAQGRGLGRILLDEVAAMAERHPQSTGVCLNTEIESNLGLYEHIGYRTLGRREVDGMATWCMFRPNDAATPG